MRLSTTSIFENGKSKIQSLQLEQVKLQTQISTGKRVNTPADDPIASSRILSLQQAQSVNTQYASNRDTANAQLSGTEVVLSNVTDLMLNIQSTVVGAGNPSLSDVDRRAVAVELSQSLDQLIGLANSKDAVGNYMFSGYRTGTIPYVKNVAGGYDYQGDTNRVALQVSESRQMEVTQTGPNVFQAGGNDIFQQLTDFIAIMNTPVATPADNAALNASIQTTIGGMKTGLDNILAARADFGAKLKEIDSLDATGLSSDIVFKQNISDLEDLDYTVALSDLAKNQIIMEAAQKSFVKTTGMSLFDLI